MTRTWYDFYKDRMNDEYRAHVRKRYAPFIDRVVSEAMQHTFVMEAGCGAANVSRIVGNRLPRRVTQVLVDRDADVLTLAHQNMDGAGNFRLVRSDILQMDQDGAHPDFSVLMKPEMYGLIYSHGVLEHMQDDQIRDAIERQMSLLAVGGRLLHYVPSDRYEKPSFGDERLMSPSRWHDICQPKMITIFNDGYDLMLEWRKR